MNAENVLNCLGKIDEKYILSYSPEEKRRSHERRKKTEFIRKAAAIAACAAIAVGLVAAGGHLLSSRSGTQKAAAQPKKTEETAITELRTIEPMRDAAYPLALEGGTVEVTETGEYIYTFNFGPADEQAAERTFDDSIVEFRVAFDPEFKTELLPTEFTAKRSGELVTNDIVVKVTTQTPQDTIYIRTPILRELIDGGETVPLSRFEVTAGSGMVEISYESGDLDYIPLEATLIVGDREIPARDGQRVYDIETGAFKRGGFLFVGVPSEGLDGAQVIFLNHFESIEPVVMAIDVHTENREER